MRALVVALMVLFAGSASALQYTFITGASGGNCAAGVQKYTSEAQALASCRPGVGWDYTNVRAVYNSARSTLYAEALRVTTNTRQYFATYEVATDCEFEVGDRLPTAGLGGDENVQTETLCYGDCKLKLQDNGLVIGADQGNATSSRFQYLEVIAQSCDAGPSGDSELYPADKPAPSTQQSCSVIGNSVVCNTERGVTVDDEFVFAMPSANQRIRLCTESGCVEPGASGVVIAPGGEMLGTPNATVPPAPPPSQQFGTYQGSQARMSANFVRITGDGGEQFLWWNSTEAARSATASSGNTPGNTGTGTSGPPSGGTTGGEGTFTGEVPTAPTFGEALEQFQADVSAAPIATAYQGITAAIPTGGVCPAVDFDIFGTTVQMNSHCTVADELRDTIRLICLITSALVAVRLFMQA